MRSASSSCSARNTAPAPPPSCWATGWACLACRAGALYIAALASWPVAYAVMAVLIGLGMLGFLIAPEPARAPLPAFQLGPWLRHAVVAPLIDFIGRRRWVAILLFMMLYNARLRPGVEPSAPLSMYSSVFPKPEIASISKVFGVIALVAGGFAGAYVVRRLGIWYALLVCGMAQTLAQFSFAWLALAGHDLVALTIAIGAEQFTGGMATSAFVAFLSSLCNRDYTATQYALFISMAAVGRDLLTAPAGYLQESVGWGRLLPADPPGRRAGAGVIVLDQKGRCG